MRKIFETSKINGMTLKNRLVRSATWEGMCAPGGAVTVKLTDYYKGLAQGGVGLIITGYAFVRPDGQQMPGQMGVHTDDLVPALAKMVRAVHDSGGTICMQLVHVGGQTTPEMIGRQPLAPSAVEAAQYGGVMPAAMTKADIEEVVEAFGEGARRAKEAGFDAVQLHAAHGYLINQFLSPLTNRRDDEYGGSLADRCLFLTEVYDRVRGAVGDAFPVMMKLNGSDNLEGGLDIDDSVEVARQLDGMGIDAIEVSGGTAASGEATPVRKKISKPEKEAYNLPLARRVKEAVSCPVISVGGYRSFEVAEKTIADDADYVAISRPLIREPNLPARWQQGDTSNATCISCNKCFIPGIKEGGIYCVVEKEKRAKKA